MGPEIYVCIYKGCGWNFPTRKDLEEHLVEAHQQSKEIRTTSSTGGQKGTKDERHDLIPTGPLAELAHHFGVGARKYEDHNWRRGYEWSKSYSAVQRHLNAFWGGEDLDECPASGEGCSFVTHELEPFISQNPGKTCYNHTGNHHLVCAAWHCFALLEFKDRFPEFDDRYVVNPDAPRSST